MLKFLFLGLFLYIKIPCHPELTYIFSMVGRFYFQSAKCSRHRKDSALALLFRTDKFTASLKSINRNV